MVRKTLWCLFACALLWAGGLTGYASWISTFKPRAEPSADAIVILTGGKGRLEHGLRLLAKNKGDALFISGVHGRVEITDLLRTMPDEIRLRLEEKNPLPITLGRSAHNTIGNAEETVRWIKDHNVKSLLLVTASYHMPRSLSEFHEIMPNVTIIPAPVTDTSYDYRLLLSEYHKYLAGKLRHWLLSVTPA